VTVHDLAFIHFPKAFDPKFRRYALVAHRPPRAAPRSSSRSPRPPRRTSTAAGGSPATASSSPVTARARSPRRAAARGDPRHFLYVGDDEPRKNLGLLLGGYARYRRAETDGDPLPLVLAGSATAAGAEGVLVARGPMRSTSPTSTPTPPRSCTRASTRASGSRRWRP
jgi:hypothetical protein